MSKVKGLKIIHLNVRSYLKKKDELYLHFKMYDIVCFSETWLNCMIPDNMLHWPGFTLWRKDRFETLDGLNSKKGGGILINFRASVIYFICE